MLEALLVFFVIIRCGLKWFAVLAQEVEHRRGKEEVPSSNLGNGLVIENKVRNSVSSASCRAFYVYLNYFY